MACVKPYCIKSLHHPSDCMTNQPYEYLYLSYIVPNSLGSFGFVCFLLCFLFLSGLVFNTTPKYKVFYSCQFIQHATVHALSIFQRKETRRERNSEGARGVGAAEKISGKKCVQFLAILFQRSRSKKEKYGCE